MMKFVRNDDICPKFSPKSSEIIIFCPKIKCPKFNNLNLFVINIVCVLTLDLAKKARLLRNRKKRRLRKNILNKYICNICIEGEEKKKKGKKKETDDEKFIHYADLLKRITFVRRRDLERHKKKEHRRKDNIERKTKCDQCHRTFTRPHDLERHIQTHKAVRVLFNCPDCQKEFRDRRSMLHHQRTSCPK